jgi:hypothetical protein
MRVFIDLNSRAFVVSPVLTQRVVELLFTRRDNVPVEVQFVRGGTVVELPAGATGKMGIKKDFDGDFLAFAGSFTKSGSGAETIYTFGLNLNTTELNAEFPEDDEESIAARVEVEYTAGGLISTTLPCAATIYNDVIRGDEGVPTSAVTTSFLLESPDESIWAVTIDDDGVLTATKQ